MIVYIISMKTSKKSAVIPLNYEVLKWARDRMNYAVEEAAQRLNVAPNRILAWESGEATPTVKQARKLAAFYDRPFLEFVFKDVPAIPKTELVPDFRFHRGFGADQKSAELIQIQRWAEEVRLNALDLIELLGEEVSSFPKHLFATVDTDVEASSLDARKALGFSVEQQTTLKASERGSLPNMLRRSIEQIGVLVLRTSDLSKANARGLCLFDEVLPVIVYGSEAPGAQAFTLMHEFAHIMLKSSAISGTPRFGGKFGHKRVEAWCNQFSAAFLMPKSELNQSLGDRPSTPHDTFDDSKLSELSKKFAVSEQAMLIRLVSLGYVQAGYYWKVKRPLFVAQEEKFKGGGRSSYYGSRYRSAHGDFYTGLVLDAWNSGQITNHNAAEFLGIKRLSHLSDIRSNFAA